MLCVLSTAFAADTKMKMISSEMLRVQNQFLGETYKIRCMDFTFLIRCSFLLLSVFSIKESDGHTVAERLDTLPNDSYDNFKANTVFSGSYVVIKSRDSGKVLFRHSLQNGFCGNCYDSIASIADSCFKEANYIDASTLYAIAFRFNHDKGRVRHRLNAACCFVKLNDTDHALENLERVVFVAKFTNYHLLSSDSCYQPLYGNPRWKLLLEGIRKNMAAMQQILKEDTPVDQ